MLRLLNPIAQKLETAGKELLDLSLRNPLLNYKTHKTRGIDIVGNKELFRVLVREGRAMFIQSMSSASSSNDRNGEKASIKKRKAQSEEYQIQSPYSAKQLMTRLSGTMSDAELFIEEQGINTLYFGIGMLEWYSVDGNKNGEGGRSVLNKAPLILVPVMLERIGINDGFQLKYTGEDILGNPVLCERLRNEFRINLPQLSEGDDFDPMTYMADISRTVANIPKWSVNKDSIVLNLFSPTEYLMHRELSDEEWGGEIKPSTHHLIRAMFQDGFARSMPLVDSDDNFDKRIGPLEITRVLDADTSQLMCISDVCQGINLAVQGAPGTGKSQTITNLIAHAIASGKKVLFVSNKAAALETVKRSLDEVGLGETCLELHSGKTGKRAIVAELQKTINPIEPEVPTNSLDLEAVKLQQQRLDAYCDALNTIVGETGVTPYDAYGELLRIKRSSGEEILPQFNLLDMISWNDAEWQRKHAVVVEMQNRLLAVGSFKDHPFRGSRLRALLPSDQQKLERSCRSAQSSTQRLRSEAEALANRLGFDIPRDKNDIDMLCKSARRILSAPDLHGIKIGTDDWRKHRDEIGDLLSACRKHLDVRERYESVLMPEAWSIDLLETRQHLINYGRKWWGGANSDFRNARNRIDGLCYYQAPEDIERKIELVDAILEARRYEEVIRRHQSLGESLFGSQWKGERSDWESLSGLFEWVMVLYLDIEENRLPKSVLTYLSGEHSKEGMLEQVEEVESQLNQQRKLAQEIIKGLDLDEDRRFGFGAKLDEVSFDYQEKLFADWAASMPGLQHIAAYNMQSDTMAREGLSEMLDVFNSRHISAAFLVSTFEQNRYERILKKAWDERPALSGFYGDGQEQTIKRYDELDNYIVEHNRKKSIDRYRRNLYEHREQLSALSREVEKKSYRTSIRKMIKTLGQAMQIVKPVFVMSPHSVASCLAPGGISFDLVIFDQAGRIRTVEAIGPVMRSKQIVVMGDSKQLPPFDHFKAYIRNTTDNHSAKDVGRDENNDGMVSDSESILSLCRAQGMHERVLRVHYRSIHESLFAVSNHEFYDDALIVYPNPMERNEVLGVGYHKVAYSVFDAATGTNSQEADVIAESVMRFACNQVKRSTDDRKSLMVVALTSEQANIIQNKLDVLRKNDSGLEEFFNRNHPEPFDIKTIENIQGDERDVVYIGIGYGHDENGLAPVDFGPISREGGERALNVLLTRARYSMKVFTNLSGDDIDGVAAESAGARILRSFLSYVEDGKSGGDHNRKHITPFESEVRAELENRGYRTDVHIGISSYRVDMAVIDPQNPQRYLLGINCDGPMYAGAKLSRDRDLLRRRALMRLGWRTHQVWSSDWFRDPDGELKKLLTSIADAETAAEDIRIADRLEQYSEEQIEIIEDHDDSISTFESDDWESAPYESDDWESVSDIELDIEQLPLSDHSEQVEIANQVDQVDRADDHSDIMKAIEAEHIDDITPKSGFLEIPYKLAKPAIKLNGGGIQAIDREQFASWITEIVHVEAPVHIDEVLRRIISVAGLSRSGHRIKEAFDAALNYAVKHGMIQKRKMFLIENETAPLLVRNRSKLPVAMRKVDLISPNEITVAIELVVNESPDIDRNDVATEVSRMLGFTRVNEDMKRMVNKLIKRMK